MCVCATCVELLWLSRSYDSIRYPTLWSQWFGFSPTPKYCHHSHLHNIGLQEVGPLSRKIDGEGGCLVQHKIWFQKPLNFGDNCLYLLSHVCILQGPHTFLIELSANVLLPKEQE